MDRLLQTQRVCNSSFFRKCLYAKRLFMKIIKFENKYRDDLIFMVLEAKNALGRKLCV